MNRTLKLSMLVALTLGSAQALAMNLGQIQVKSRLDAPLVAEIPLILSYPGEADGLKVALASAEDFSRAGINRSQLKVPLQFAVVTLAQGEKVIRVTSSEPVREPYLDFLVQVNWPKGKLLREYTVLLDPAGSVMTVTPTQQAPQQAATPAQPSAAPAPAATPASAPSASRVQDGHYRVQSGDTLSEIAEDTRLSGVSYQQMLLALKVANPDAFFRDNINALKSGAVLRIPTASEAQAQNTAAATAEVRRQNQDWRGAAAAAPTMVATTGGRASDNDATADTSSSAAGDRLALVPPSEGSGSGTRAGVAGGSSDATVASLRQQLARSKEALSSQQQQADELQARVKDLEGISDKNKRLLGLKDAEIAELQQKLAEARKLASQPAAATTAAPTSGRIVAPVPAATAAAMAASSSAPAASGTAAVAAATAGSAAAPASSAPLPVAAMSAATPAMAASVAASAPAVPAKPVATTSPARTEPPAVAAPTSAQTPWYRQTWAMAAGLVILLGLLLLALTRRRRKAPAAARPSLADQFSDSPLGGAAAAGAADLGIADMDSDESELLTQLAEHPDDIGLHLELVSLYYGHHDVEHFEGAAEAMYAHVSDPDQPEWQDVRAMGEELAPGHPLFAIDGATPPSPDAADEHEALQNFDLDTYASDAHDEAAEPEPASPPRSTGYNFDFDLTPPRVDAPPATEAPAMEEFDALPPLPEDDHVPPAADDDATVVRPHFDTPAEIPGDDDDATVVRSGAGFGDDAVDTKLDLARAYIDMGDPDGARAMLEEVMSEGSQIQKDVAQKLLDEMG